MSSDDDDYYQPDSFAPYTQEYRFRQHRPNLASHNTNFYPQNSASTQTHLTIDNAKPNYTQSYEPIQTKNPTNTNSYQPVQM